MGSISQLPIANMKLHLLWLDIEDRAGFFESPVEKHKRHFLKVDENGSLLVWELQQFIPGSLISNPRGQQLPDGLVKQATRITKEQFTVWDNLTIIDRLQLQVSWAEDALRRAEEDLLHAIKIADEDGWHPTETRGKERWSIPGLMRLVDRIRHADEVLEGLEIALGSL